VHVELREGARARHAEFVSASGAPQKSVLVEGLDAEYYYGGAKFFDRAGHVPHAVMMPSDDLFNADKTFKSSSEIERMFSHIGITPNRQIITYCGGGVAASLSYFAAKFLLGYPDVKLYKGSQREWLRDDRGLPFWTFAQPNRLRDRQWVNGWNSDMMRMMEASQLNIIDSRATDIRARGTIPHSLAIPAANLKPHLASPQKLADVLGKAGLVQEHEAVILSDGGITPDAALTMLLLENLGHAKVSIINGSYDDWALAGLPTTKAAAVATVRVQQYASRPRNDVFITLDKVTTPTTTPRIILVAGKLNSSLKPAGHVIEIPYTDFINKNGSPKPANDIWNLLAKAGVSRYAEIICVADELGEAAVSYVVLKMMGYADVKVMQPSLKNT
jgi:3-mercaptopyruvate sulfurtransferase SseA